MAMKPVLTLLSVLVFPSFGVLAQQPTSAGPPAVPVEIEEWMRAAWGMDPQVLGFTDTHFLLSLSESERQGAFLFKQRCNTCHYSMMSTTRGARAGLLSYGPPLSKRNVEGEGRERAARLKISEGSATMPAFKYALRPEEINLIISYLKKVDTLRPAVLDRLVEISSTSQTGMVSFAQTGPTLWGTITSTSGEKLEGVTVSVRAEGRNVTTSVFTDSDGEYYFPPLEDGKPYKAWAQAQAFEAGRADVALNGSGVRRDFTLKPKADFENQLTGSQWYAALPDGTREDRRMKEVFRAACMGCHPQNFTLINRFDEEGWRNIITVMSRIGPYGYGDPAQAARREPNAIMAHFENQLVAWLAKVRGPGPSPMKFTPRRPTGDSTLMIAREYDAPEPGFGLPFFNDGSTNWALGPVDFMDESKHHAMNATVDHDGNVWMADMFNITRTVVKYDWMTGQATNFVVSETPGGPPANSHDIIVDNEGVVWFDMSSIGALGRIDPRTGKSEIIRPPEGSRVGPWIGEDGKRGIWAAGYADDAKAMRYDTQTRQWTLFKNPIPNASNYGMIGDGDGNGWWSTANPRDGLMKADLETGQTSFVPVPEAVNNRADLFTSEELTVFADRLDFYGYGRPGAVAVRKPGADPRGAAVWACSWYGGGLVKLDSRSHRATMYPFPPQHADGNCYETSVDKDGMVWLPFTHGDAIAKFDPKTERWTSYFLPTIGTKTHGLQAATVNGRTQIGMGYLGAGKVAKLEFRTREELQRLKASLGPG